MSSPVPGRLAIAVASFGVLAPIVAWLCLPAYVLLVSQQSDLTDYGTPLWTFIDLVLGSLVLVMVLIVMALVPVWLVSCAVNAAAWFASRGADPPDPRPRRALFLNVVAPLSWVGETLVVLGFLFWLLQGFRL